MLFKSPRDMRFRADFSQHRIPNGVLVYRTKEYSFDVDPRPNGFTSVLLDNLHLGVDRTGRVVSVWGMCPHTRWQMTTLHQPRAESGELFFESDSPLLQGVSIALSSNRCLSIETDVKSGWVRIQGWGAGAISVKLMSGIIVELTNEGQLHALWLRPQRDKAH